MASIDIQVPDIGDFSEVAVIEILVKVGDHVKVEQSLITVESDKASMEIPCSHAGVVKELKVKLSDKVKKGSVLLTLELADSAQAPAQPAPSVETAAPSKPSASQVSVAPAAAAVISSPEPSDVDCDVLVLGGGPGGYSAAFRAADLGLKVILVERYASLGGVCLNVGCIPSKALLHVASVMDEVSHLSSMGISFSAPSINLDQLRAHKDKVISKLTGGLGAMAKMRKVEVVRGFGFFAGPHTLAVEETQGSAQEKSGKTRQLKFKRAIIAVGSQAVRLPFMPEDPGARIRHLRVLQHDSLVGAGAYQRNVPCVQIIRLQALDQMQAEMGPHAGAQDLGRTQGRSPTQGHNLAHTESGRAAQNRAHITGILYPVQQNCADARQGLRRQRDIHYKTHIGW